MFFWQNPSLINRFSNFYFRLFLFLFLPHFILIWSFHNPPSSLWGILWKGTISPFFMLLFYSAFCYNLLLDFGKDKLMFSSINLISLYYVDKTLSEICLHNNYLVIRKIRKWMKKFLEANHFLLINTTCIMQTMKNSIPEGDT